MSTLTKPVPRPTPESQLFWDSAQQRKLALQHCRSCDQFWFPPSARCRHCLSTDFAWQEVSGKGRIYSFVVYHRLYHPAFEQDLPYVVALVELREGPRLLTNIIGTPPDNIRCDLPVHVIFEESDGDFLIPKFKIDGR
jgi:uncharacterized OB-fold protein